MSKYTKENPPVVSRNGVSLQLQLTKFGKTSDRKGQEFWTLESTAANRNNMRTFASEETVDTVFSRFLRRVAQDIHIDNTDNNTGVTDIEGVIADWADFTSGNATMSDLEEQIGELVDVAQNIVMDDKYATDDNTGQPVHPEDYIRLTEQMKDIQKKIKPLKAQLLEIQKKHAAAAAKRAAAKEAKAAASPSRVA